MRVWPRPLVAILVIVLLGVLDGSGRVLAQQVNPGSTSVPSKIVAEVNSSGSKDDAETTTYALPPSIAPLDVVNEHLPKWIRFSGLYRVRLEGYGGLYYKPNTEDTYLLNRFRFGMLVRPASWFKFYSEAQDARAYRKAPPVSPAAENAWDLRNAYIELGNGDDSMFGMKVGRQEVQFGNGRLIGRADWRNAGRVFDAALASLKVNRFRMTAFSLSIINPLTQGISHHQQGSAVHGLYGGIDKLIPNSVIEPYVMWRVAPGFRTDAGNPAKLDQKTVGVRWAGMVSRHFDYTAELAGQTGRISSDSIGAWMTTVLAGYTVTQLRGKPRFFAEYFFASGDATPGDGRRATWLQVYPAVHDSSGLADQVGWQNLKEFRTGSRFFVARNWAVAGVYVDWYLANAKDAFYNASGTVIGRDTTGKSGTHIGQELDLETSYRLSRQIEVGAGISHILPGEFLKQTTPGKTYTYSYVMISYVL